MVLVLVVLLPLRLADRLLWSPKPSCRMVSASGGHPQVGHAPPKFTAICQHGRQTRYPQRHAGCCAKPTSSWQEGHCSEFPLFNLSEGGAGEDSPRCEMGTIWRMLLGVCPKQTVRSAVDVRAYNVFLFRLPLSALLTLW